MTEFELIEAYQGAEASWQGLVGIYFSTVFTYFVVAYLVGSKLSRSQTVIATCLYTLFGWILLVALFDINSRMIEFALELFEINPERSVGGLNSSNPQSVRFGPPIITGIFFCMYVAGLLFMFQTRRSARKLS